jgi:hypothetical protein
MKVLRAAAGDDAWPWTELNIFSLQHSFNKAAPCGRVGH